MIDEMIEDKMIEDKILAGVWDVFN